MTVATDATTSTRRVDQLLAHYEESHRHPTNELIHCFAIPAIGISLIGLLYALHPWLAYGVVAASLIYYLRLGSPIFLLSMAVFAAVALALVHAMGPHALAVSAGIFVVAWIAQFVGHALEGKKPSFFEDLQYLLVGPLFVLSRLFVKAGIRW